MSDDVVPDATIARIPVYLRALEAFAERGQATVSSAELAEASGSQPAQLRRDLTYFGTFGTRGVGYDISLLHKSLSAHVGGTRTWSLVLVGAGNLGSALARQFSRAPFRVAAIVDVDPDVVGTTRGDVLVRPQHELARAIAETGASIGIIATPPHAADEACAALAAAGIASILNFAPALLHPQPGVTVRNVDLAQELQILAFHESQRLASAFGHVPGHRPYSDPVVNPRPRFGKGRRPRTE